MEPHRTSHPFPIQPVALKILGDGILAVTLLRAGQLPPDSALMAVLVAIALALGTSSLAGVMLVRQGERQLWDITAIACLIAMAVLLVLHGALLIAALLGMLAHWRWRQVQDGQVAP